jgi:diguanylate cyclase (GGDEF)-like protein/PAS domain S-box-containing protein
MTFDPLRLALHDALMQSVSDHVWVLDLQGRYLIANPAFLQSSGLTASDVIGKTPPEVFPGETGAHYHALDMQVMREGTPVTREDIIGTGDDTQYVELVKTPLFNPAGECIGLAGVARDVTLRRQTELALERAFGELYERSIRDVLTPSYNRRHTMERAQQALVRGGLAIIMFDLDHFKRVNDTYGHAAGDTLLIEVCKTANAQLAPAASLGRLGGEEFCILLPEAELNHAARLAENVREAIAEIEVRADNHLIKATASFGVSANAPTLRTDAKAVQSVLSQILKASDDALYRAKTLGRNRVETAQLQRNS